MPGERKLFFELSFIFVCFCMKKKQTFFFHINKTHAFEMTKFNGGGGVDCTQFPLDKLFIYSDFKQNYSLSAQPPLPLFFFSLFTPMCTPNIFF